MACSCEPIVIEPNIDKCFTRPILACSGDSTALKNPAWDGCKCLGPVNLLVDASVLGASTLLYNQ